MTPRLGRYVAAAFAAAMTSYSAVIPVAAQPLPGTTCALFPADSIFNADISALPVNAQSTTWMGNMTQNANLHPDVGTFAQQYGIPINVAPPPTTSVTPTFLYNSDSDHPAEGYPIDQSTLIEGGPGAPTTSDRHALVVNKNLCKLYEIFNLQNFTYGQTPSAGSGAVWDLTSDAMRTAGFTSADAAGLPMTPLLLRPDEILAGSITHAIRLTAHCTINGYIWPASHQAGSCGAGFPPMGARFRLKSTFNISGFSATTQVVLRAFQHYGLMLADNGSDWYFGGTTDDWWGTTAGSTVVSELKTIPAAQFDAVDESGMQAAAGSYRAMGAVAFAPSRLDFSGQAPTTTSSAQTVTLHNNQSVVLNVTTATLTGANAGSYVKGTDTCTGVAVPANGACTVQVSFHPAALGGFPATLTFTDDGPASPQTVALNGMGALDNQSLLYTLDGYGGIHANGTSPVMSAGTYWPGWNIARSISLFPDGTGGYVLDGYGGLHPFGSAGPVTGNPYWSGFDIARQVVLAPWSTASTPAGWTLDGYGGLHPFGGAPAVSGYPYWGGWDIVRGVAILPDSTPSSVAGYTLDGWGGVHAFGGAPAIGNASYWPGYDIARGLTLTPNASKANAAGWSLDAYGGVHPFGSAPAVSASSYWPGWDIARGVVAWTGNNSAGGWVLDGYGGLHPFGGSPAVTAGAYWSGWDIATSLGGPNFGSGSRRRA